MRSHNRSCHLFSYDPEMRDPVGKWDRNTQPAPPNMPRSSNAATGPMRTASPMLGSLGTSNTQPPEVVRTPIIPPPPSRPFTPEQLRRILEVSGLCTGGMMSSRSFNPNGQRNIQVGLTIGASAGAIIGGISAAWLVAAAPATEGLSLLLLLGDNPLMAGATGGAIGAMYGAGGGIVGGYVFTSPTNVSCQ